jgi:hypothetical protein
MPQLVWEPVDLLVVLDVAPIIGDHDTSHQYNVEQGPVKLRLTVWQYDSDVEILLWASPLPGPVVRYSMLDCPGIRVIEDNRGKFLEFAAANTFTSRYDGYSVIPYGLRLWIQPQLLLEPFVYRV